MPRLDRDPAASGPLVQGFAGGGFSVDGSIYRALLLTPTSVSEWRAPALEELGTGHLSLILGIDPPPAFLLLGTGPTLVFPPRAFKAALEEKHIGLEVMDSRAAARIWGLLRSEERWIVAALMPI